ncbi:MAG: hypothetical protein M1616_01410 [Candidatus Thermoplasmatota archaeon]|nr:hypothetical protein [Candidatus Thermoplasmatota archaeon]
MSDESKGRSIIKIRPLWGALTAVFLGLTGFSLFRAFGYSGDISTYSTEFQSLNTVNATYNTTRSMLLRFDTLQLGWALTGVVAICLVVLCLVVLLFFSKQ